MIFFCLPSLLLFLLSLSLLLLVLSSFFSYQFSSFSSLYPLLTRNHFNTFTFITFCDKKNMLYHLFYSNCMLWSIFGFRIILLNVVDSFDVVIVIVITAVIQLLKMPNFIFQSNIKQYYIIKIYSIVKLTIFVVVIIIMMRWWW